MKVKAATSARVSFQLLTGFRHHGVTRRAGTLMVGGRDAEGEVLPARQLWHRARAVGGVARVGRPKPVGRHGDVEPRPGGVLPDHPGRVGETVRFHLGDAGDAGSWRQQTNKQPL